MNLRDEGIRSRRVTRALQNAKREIETALRYMKASESYKDSPTNNDASKAFYLVDSAIDSSLDLGFELSSRYLAEVAETKKASL